MIQLVFNFFDDYKNIEIEEPFKNKEYANGAKKYVDKHLWKSFYEAKADLEAWKSFAHMSDW